MRHLERSRPLPACSLLSVLLVTLLFCGVFMSSCGSKTPSTYVELEYGVKALTQPKGVKRRPS